MTKGSCAISRSARLPCRSKGWPAGNTATKGSLRSVRKVAACVSSSGVRTIPMSRPSLLSMRMMRVEVASDSTSSTPGNWARNADTSFGSSW